MGRFIRGSLGEKHFRTAPGAGRVLGTFISSASMCRGSCVKITLGYFTGNIYFHSKLDSKLNLIRVDEVNYFKMMHLHRLNLDPENFGVLFCA